MSDAHADVSKHVRVYWMVFGALVVGTILTVVVVIGILVLLTDGEVLEPFTYMNF